jgi:two-component system cell cycle response regulator
VAKAEKPDLILLDVTMPVMDGVEMLTRLKTDPELKGIPVVMLTAEAGRENILKIAKIGVRDYIVKPFTEPVLVEKLGRIMTFEPAGASAAPAAGGANDTRTVILLDDKPAVVQQVKDAVKNSAWTWQSASSPAEALALAEKKKPDAIVASLSLPEDGAVGLMRIFRSRPALAETPFIGLAVKTAVDEKQRALESGFLGVAAKPIDAQDLESKIRRALKLENITRSVELTKEHLLVRLSEDMTVPQLDAASVQLAEKAPQAVDSGLGLVVFDLSAVRTCTVDVLKFLIHAMAKCEDLGMRTALVGSAELAASSRMFDEAKDWQFRESLELVNA